METPTKRSSISRKPIGGQKAVNVANAVQATQSPPLSPTQQNINFPVPNHLIDYDFPPDMPNRPGTFSYGLSSLAETTPVTSPSNDLNINLVQSPTQVVGPGFKTIPHPSNNIVSSPPLSGYTAGVPSPPPSFSSASQSVTGEDHTMRSATSYFPPNVVPLSSVTGTPLTVNNAAIVTEANQATATNPNLPKSVSHTVDNHILPNETNPSLLSTSAPPDLKFPHDRQIESASFASLCCQCSSAVPYDVFYYRCTYCRLDICGTCFQSGKHPWTHLPSLIRLKAQETKAGDRRQERHYSSCNEMSHCRLDCDECEYSICFSCFDKEKAGPHQHRSFTLVTPPGLSLSSIRDNGPPCCLAPSFGHCGRCYAPWKPEEWIIKCKTCVFEFDEVVGLCSSCDAEVLSTCRQKDHQLVAMKCRQKMKDEGRLGSAQEIQVMVECTECPSHFHSMTDIAFLRHSHSNYNYVFFTNDGEQVFASTYRNCKKKAARVDIPLAPTESSVECSYCQHKFPAEVIQSCLACSGTKYCPHCFPIASLGHQDGLKNFVSENDVKQIKLGGGWTQRMNSEGRTWYQNAKTNTSTFETPSSITTLGNEKPPNQRRATTGQIPSTSAAGAESAAGSRLPPGWEARKTMEGRRYFVCHETKKTTWERPTAPDTTQPAKPKAQRKRHSSMPLAATPQTPVAANPVSPIQAVVTQAPGFNAAVASPSTEVPMTAEEKHAAKVAAQKKKQRNKMMMKIGTSVLKGVVSGAIQSG